MTFLSEDPTYVAGALGVLAGAFLIALRVTQQGKYLIWALSVAGISNDGSPGRAVLGHGQRADRTGGVRPQARCHDVRRRGGFEAPDA